MKTSFKERRFFNTHFKQDFEQVCELSEIMKKEQSFWLRSLHITLNELKDHYLHCKHKSSCIFSSFSLSM